MSFATIALWVAGAGIAAMALTAIALAVIPLAPAGKALLALAGIVLTIVAMSVASSQATKRALRAEYGNNPDENTTEHSSGEATDGVEGDAGLTGGTDRRGPSDGLQPGPRDGLG